MFPKGKYNTDISRNAQYHALFRRPSDRKQIGTIGKRYYLVECHERCVWENYRLEAQAVRKIPEGYVIIEMYTKSPNGINHCRPGVVINDGRYWRVKLKHRSAGHIKWMDLHESTVQSIVKETMETQQNHTYNKLLR